ncbi:MAG: hypothetical protein SFY81_14635 [Verrucomicrobiota bacterium]|nr:hypothetical protein [Verrucomicrobiota bacterium]
MSSGVKKLLIICGVLLLMAVGGWFGRKSYLKVAERRSLEEARRYFAKNDFRQAGLCLQRVLQLNPVNIEACRLTAEMLDKVDSAAAIQWRVRTAKLETNNPAHLFELAQTALKHRDHRTAAAALNSLTGDARGSGKYHELAGALAWSLNDPLKAEKEFETALRLSPTNELVRLNLARTRLSSTNPSVSANAREMLLSVPSGSPLRVFSLRSLVSDAMGANNLKAATAYSRELVELRAAYPTDRIAHLEILRKGNSPEYGKCRNELMVRATNSPNEAFLLGRWMIGAEGPKATVDWLHQLPAEIQTNQPVTLLIVDCYIALKEWERLIEFSRGQRWEGEGYYGMALEALAYRRLEKNQNGSASWQKALRLAGGGLERLKKLAQLATAWGLQGEANEALQQLAVRFPKEKWAADQLIKNFYAEGNTSAIRNLLARLSSADPEDIRCKNNLASILLLQKMELTKAHQLAEEAYRSSPGNAFFVSTYAYSLSLQGKNVEAAALMEGLSAQDLESPSIALYYGLVQLQAGNKSAAKQALGRAMTGKLLPEEVELARTAL